MTTDAQARASHHELRTAAGTQRRTVGMGRCACLLLPLSLLTACDSASSGGQLQVNEPAGLELYRPGFLQSRKIDDTRVEARVRVDVGDVEYPVVQLASPAGDTSWRGEVQVPQGSDVTLTVDWVETGVEDLPAELGGELLLANYSVDISGINSNRAVDVDISEYVIESTEEDPRPELDLDGDGFGNLRERLEGTGPNDADQIPPEVVIAYHPRAPRIDGSYDSIWNNAQFVDEADNDLFINQVLIDKGVVQPGEDRRYRWGAMHDGEFLYLMVFGEKFGEQTPFGDSDLAYEDDAIDIFWDGNNSKGASYDGVDDYHAIIPLLTSQGAANATGRADTRLDSGDRSIPVDVSMFEFAVCLCNAPEQQQVYEVKLDLQAANIPVDEPFGLDIQLNNDVDGGDRDAKWAWHNDSGQDDTWRFPVRMGTARLEPAP
ncbi:sugar-binding protein [Granulosicoccus sp. 3-233]|uniref:sugar-binding protein n=1 Tax=Granulosicoccus sp. 3-233 TaxID=3417969 RepID=UPI003D345A16